jgi:hypothetical protein
MTVNDLRQWQYDARVQQSVRRLAGDAADEIERLLRIAKGLSDVLLTIRPLAGSEAFCRYGSGDSEMYLADPVYFRAAIEALKASARRHGESVAAQVGDDK